MNLGLNCPHCATVHKDDLELLDTDELREMRCSECGKTFWFLLHDCGRCAEEQVFTWPTKPQDQSTTNIECNSCGHPFKDKDPDDETGHAQSAS